MSPDSIQHQWSDAWLLLSIIYASREQPATLVSVIQCGDAINRAVFTPSELKSGYFRLTKGGWVTGSDDAWTPSKRAEEFYGTIQKMKLSPYAEMKQIQRALGAPDWSAETNANNPSDIFEYPGMTNNRIAKACRDYSRGFWKAYKQLKKKMANGPMHLTTMPAALLARRLRSRLWCQKQVVAGDWGRWAKKYCATVTPHLHFRHDDVDRS